MKYLGMVATSLLLSVLYSSDTFAVSAIASFTPSTVRVGESTTFAWQGQGICEVEGLPGGNRYGKSGSFTFAAESNITAHVLCEVADTFGGAHATLTVSNLPPTVTASYSPASTPVGGSTTLTWSSTNTTNCSSPQNGSVSGVSGSITVPAAPAPGTQTTTINCIGSGGTVSQNVSLTTTAFIQRPIVNVWASPTVIFSPTTVFFYWQSYNASGCDRGLFGSTSLYIGSSGYFWVTCWGAGGTTSNFASVSYYGNWFSAPTNSTLTDTRKAVNQPDTPMPDLKHIGIDLSKKRMKYINVDLNRDGFQDVVVVDALKKTAYIIISQAGKYTSISKTMTGINKIDQIKSIFVPSQSAHDAMQVTIENMK